MGRLFGWIAGLVGIAALARVLARRSRRAQPVPAAAPAEDPAAALRQKLAETRGSPASGPAETMNADEERSETLEERRARVHAKAHEALEAMDALEEQPR